jgi:hypothetical protein
MLLPTVLKLFGVEISQEEIDLLGQNLDVLVEAVTALVGFVVAIYGRWNALSLSLVISMEQNA